MLPQEPRLEDVLEQDKGGHRDDVEHAERDERRARPHLGLVPAELARVEEHEVHGAGPAAAGRNESRGFDAVTMHPEEDEARDRVLGGLGDGRRQVLGRRRVRLW